MIFVSVLALILTLLLVAGIHEGGHALAARLFKVRIRKISVGFGKILFSYTSKSGCQWVWSFWPLGGYVELYNTRITPVAPEEEQYCLDKKSSFARAIIYLSGVLANGIFALILLTLVARIGVEKTPMRVQNVISGSLMQRSGVIAGDQWLSLGGETIRNPGELGMGLLIHLGEPEVTAEVQRANGTVVKLTLDLQSLNTHQGPGNLFSLLGLQPDIKAKPQLDKANSLTEALNSALRQVLLLFSFFIHVLMDLITGLIPFSVLLGPLGMFSLIILTFSQGLMVFFTFIAYFSIAVAVVNLLPFPGLDGGSLLYLLLEKFRGKPLSVAMEILLLRLAAVIFFLVLVHLLVNDLNRLNL